MLDAVYSGSHTRGHALGQHLRLAGSGPGFKKDVCQQVLMNKAT
jgi:hypothetical protein